MKIGKMPESVLRRSVWKQLTLENESVIQGPDMGEDSTVIRGNQECYAITSDPVTGNYEEVGRRAVHVAVNNLAATGATPVGITTVILMPLEAKEKHLKTIVSDIEKTCHSLGITVLGGHTESTSAVNSIVITVTGIGALCESDIYATKNAKIEEDIVMVGFAGMEGTGLIAKSQKQQLNTRYGLDFIEQGEALLEELSIVKAAKIAMAHGISSMHDARKGGIYGGLWDIACAAQLGVYIDLDQVPVKQETVEICEFFDLNPYKLLSGGSLLITTSRGNALVGKLREEGISATVIGTTIKDQKCVIVRDGEEGYLEPPKSDEIYHVLTGGAEL